MNPRASWISTFIVSASSGLTERACLGEVGEVEHDSWNQPPTSTRMHKHEIYVQTWDTYLYMDMWLHMWMTHENAIIFEESKITSFQLAIELWVKFLWIYGEHFLSQNIPLFLVIRFFFLTCTTSWETESYTNLKECKSVIMTLLVLWIYTLLLYEHAIGCKCPILKNPCF